MNKLIASAFPSWAKKFHKGLSESFYNVAISHFSKNGEDAKVIMNVDHAGGQNEFFSDETIHIKDGSWFGHTIFPSDFKLNSKMWWFASGWIRSRNQILNGGCWDTTPFSKHDQVCFVGLVEMHENTLNRVKIKLESLGVELSDGQIRELHDDLVAHYLMNQEVIIGEEVSE